MQVNGVTISRDWWNNRMADNMALVHSHSTAKWANFLLYSTTSASWLIRPIISPTKKYPIDTGIQIKVQRMIQCSIERWSPFWELRRHERRRHEKMLNSSILQVDLNSKVKTPSSRQSMPLLLCINNDNISHDDLHIASAPFCAFQNSVWVKFSKKDVTNQGKRVAFFMSSLFLVLTQNDWSNTGK